MEYDFENMPEYLRTQLICNLLDKGEIRIKSIPRIYFNNEVCHKLIDINYHNIEEIPKILRTREICLKIPYVKMQYFPDFYKSEIALSAVKEDPTYLRSISDYLKTKEICLEAVKSVIVTKSSKFYYFIKTFIPDQFHEICDAYFQAEMSKIF